MSTPDSTPTHEPWEMGIGQPYARIDLNPIPESTLSPQSGTLDLASVDSQGRVELLYKNIAVSPLV